MKKIYVIQAESHYVDRFFAIEPVAYDNKHEAGIQARALMDQFQRDVMEEHPDKLVKSKLLNLDDADLHIELLLFPNPFEEPVVLVDVYVKELILKC